MPRHKHYEVKASPQAPPENSSLTAAPILSACIDLAEASGHRRNGSNIRRIDLSRWMGRGVDVWLQAFIDTLRYLLQRGDRQTATIVNYA